MLYGNLVHGRCPRCRTVYRWEKRDKLQVRDAQCGDCETTLTTTCGAPTRSPNVQDVDADWLRRADAE